MRWRIRLLVSLLALSGWSTGTQAAFELVGGGARSLALGGTLGAASASADAVWNNPAGNARATFLQVSSTYARLYPELDAGLSLSTMAAMLPLGRGTAQLGYSTFGYEDWREQVLTVAYAGRIHPRWALGAGLQSRNWDAGALAHRSWRMDFGGTYEVGWVTRDAFVRLAAVATNVGGANVASGDHGAGDTPRDFALGVSIRGIRNEFLLDLAWERQRARLRFGYESHTPSLGGVDLRLGGTAPVSEWDAGELDAGLGLQRDGWCFDYAYTYPLLLSGWGSTHWVSLGYRRQ